jgi:lipid-binding SYLF domain-containing protein
MRVARTIVVSAGAVLVAVAAFAELPKSEAKRLNQAAAVVSEIRNSDNGIPEDVWNKADCVVVIPGLKKAGFIIGGEFGSGAMSCRNGGAWGPPVFMSLTKGSAGFQIGAESIDLVLLVMNRSGAEKLLSNNVTLGADASIAAGPVGRTGSAGTDAKLSAEMLSYSRSKGLFAGIDLSGGALKPDRSANAKAYGPNPAPKDIALGTAPVSLSAEARTFTEALGRGVRATSGVK